MITYKLIRGIITISLILSIAYVSRQRWAKKTKISFIIISLICLVLLSAYPIENNFYTFKSPENAFKYVHDADISNSVVGKDSAMVVGENSKGVIIEEYIIKKGEGWRLKGINDVQEIKSVFYDDYSIAISKCNNDYYIWLCGALFSVSDNKNSTFYPIYGKYPSTMSYAHIDNITDYELTINGETIKIS